ncbi:MAG TPA: hypothetical protein VFT29_11670 [Gemmatimonadaceae bacterium]|nr:hypothetical protein [Gemmatimonadaceae bacterium]
MSDTSAWRALLALDDGNVFVLNALVQALDPSSGRPRWTSVAPSDFRSLALAGFDGVRDASWLYFTTTLGIAKVRAP